MVAKDNSEIVSDSGSTLQVKALRECTRQMLELANRGITRLAFLDDAARLISESVKCDTVRVILRDSGRRFFVELERDHADEAVQNVLNEGPFTTTRPSWTSASNDSMEEICQQLMLSQGNPRLPWFTDSGDFCIEDSRAFPDWEQWCDGGGDTPGLRASRDCRSMLIVPVDGTRRRLGLIQMESRRPRFFGGKNAERFDHLVQTFGFAVDLRNLQVALRERVKELSCLCGIARLVARAELSLEEVLQSAVELLPPGWLYPEIVAARIVLDDHSYLTGDVDHVVQSMTTDLFFGNTKRGFVEVGYTQERPCIDEGPFLLEERHLMDTIARELCFVIEQKSLAEEKERLEMQLRHADRLATIGQLAAGVAHELNEPLSTIMGFAQLAAKQPGVPEGTVRDTGKIVAAALHAREIIKELLVFAREAKPVKIAFNLNDLIRDGLSFLESRFVMAGISLRCDLEARLPDITADRSQILQVLTNLVVNSVQAMPNGGQLTITTLSTDSDILLIVEDTGCGMDETTLKNLFHPFYSTKDVDAGTGLGLSVVHGIVASHTGYIDVESQQGKGSRFRIRLPVQPANGDKET